DPDRPALGDAVGAGGGRGDPERDRGHQVRPHGCPRRGPPPHRAGHRRGLPNPRGARGWGDPSRPAMNDDPAPSHQLADDLSVVVSNGQDVSVDEADVVDAALRTLRGEGVQRGELAVSLVGPEEMEELHVRYLDEPGPTDVLSFPMDEDGLLGDVVICPAA